MIQKVFFVDKEGNEIQGEDIGSHVGLAEQIIEQDERLKNEYNSGNNIMRSSANFLQESKGFMRGSQIGEYKNIIFDSSSLTENQRKALRGYYEEGYKLMDSYAEKLRKQQRDNGDER